MKACEVKEVKMYNEYILSTELGECSLVLEFYNIEKPRAGDKMLIHHNLLDKNSVKFVQPYAFELEENLEAKDIHESDFMEYIILKMNNKNYVLKRIYG